MQQKTELIEAARKVRENAHAPYSKYKVGAALLDKQGRIHVGVNVENSASPSGMCAERCALGSAVAAGATAFVAIAVVTDPGSGGAPGTPCGMCRQALSEFGLELKVILATDSGEDEQVSEHLLWDLLPHAFSATNL